MKYRKKPVTIDAYQTDVEMDIPTLEGTMHANIGDYIITGVRGEQYPCKPDIFIETYEPAYDAGYRDGSIHYELDHCPACKNVADLQEALEENAKLREYVTNLEQANIALDSDNTDLLCDMKDMQFFITENAKLRDLMQSIYMAYIGALNECESLNEELIWDSSGSIDADIAKSKERFETDRHRFDVAMNELGIEVNE